MKTLWTPLLAALALWGAGSLAAADDAGVAIKVGDDGIEFRVGNELVTRYHTGSTVAKPYFWPLNAAGGVAVTRGWPMEKGLPDETADHIHQKSAWFCHGDVIPEGMELKSKVKGVAGVDFWSETANHGQIFCNGIGEPKLDKGHGQIATHNEWRTAEGAKVLEETRTLHLYDFGGTRLLVVDIDLLASAVPLTFGDTKEGSFGIRINDSIREAKGKGKIENAEGKVGEKECWGQLSAWCDYSGTIGDKQVGLTILTDPANPYPTCWHSRGYGLMAANPFGRAKSGFPAMKGKTDLVKMAKGDHLKMRFGLLIHPGDAKEGKVEEFYQKFLKLKG